MLRTEGPRRSSLIKRIEREVRGLGLKANRCILRNEILFNDDRYVSFFPSLSLSSRPEGGGAWKIRYVENKVEKARRWRRGKYWITLFGKLIVTISVKI